MSNQTGFTVIKTGLVSYEELAELKLFPLVEALTYYFMTYFFMAKSDTSFHFTPSGTLMPLTQGSLLAFKNKHAA